jgi:hypothetical protein
MSKRDLGFPAPTCRVKSCPRHGQNLWLSAEYPRAVKGSNGEQIVSLYLFNCRLQKPYQQLHSEYVGPNGESVLRGARGKFGFTDIRTGKQVEIESSHARAMAQPALRQRFSKLSKARWSDANFRARAVDTIRQTNQRPERRKQISAAMKLRATDPNYIEHQREMAHKTWADPTVARRRTRGTKKISGLKAAWARRKVRMQELEALAKRGQPGRRATRAPIFAEAHKLHQTGISWSKIARQLIPAEYRQDPEGTLDRLKKGVRYYAKQK